MCVEKNRNDIPVGYMKDIKEVNKKRLIFANKKKVVVGFIPTIISHLIK